MNQSYPYPIPGATNTNPNAFVADNTGFLGDVDQSPDAKTLVSVDYSQLTQGVTLTGYSFRVSPGGSPQLWLSGSAITGASLSFYVSGGIGGVQYTVEVIATLGDTELRTDTLNVNIQGDGCSCVALAPVPVTSGVVSSDGLIIVNTSPRFFVSATPPVGPNVLDRWYDVVTDQIFDYVSNGPITYWTPAGGSGGGGGGGGGGGAGDAANIVKIDAIVPDGSTATFSLTAGATLVNVAGSNYLFVSVDGVWQEPSTQYAAVGNTITFNVPPSADSAVFMLWFAPPMGP